MMFISQNVLHNKRPFEGKQNADALDENGFGPTAFGLNAVPGLMRHFK